MEALLDYVNALDRLCRLAGTTASEQLKNKCLGTLTKAQLREGKRLFEYHSRRLLAERARRETIRMIVALRERASYEEPSVKRRRK